MDDRLGVFWRQSAQSPKKEPMSKQRGLFCGVSKTARGKLSPETEGSQVRVVELVWKLGRLEPLEGGLKGGFPLHRARGQKKDVTVVDRVQRAATKTAAGLKSVDYETQLAVLGLFPPEYLRLGGDLILTCALFEQGCADSFLPLIQLTHGGYM
ncbi:hypothetical protein CLF_109862, partial [Clonorchis sinensis]